jgi:hypothetical protein
LVAGGGDGGFGHGGGDGGLGIDFGDDDAPAPDGGGVCGMLLSLLLTPYSTIIIGCSVFPTSATSWKVMLLSLLLPPCSPPIVYSTTAAYGSWGCQAYTPGTHARKEEE